MIAYRNSILNRVLHNPFGPVCIRRLIISCQTLLCPDLMYSTARGSVPSIPESDWRLIAREHKFLGVVTDHSPKVERAFSCAEVGLECDPLRQSGEGLLEPWCCAQG